MSSAGDALEMLENNVQKFGMFGCRFMVSGHQVSKK